MNATALVIATVFSGINLHIMVYKERFELVGTERQQAILKAALDKIMFPWHVLTPRKERGKFIISWGNLNRSPLLNSRKHEGPHPKETDPPHAINGKMYGRKYIYGIFYPYSGDMVIDNLLMNYPALAQSTVSAECAHLADYFMPMTDRMRKEISILVHNGVDVEHGHTGWWEKSDYGAEYYNLVAESFMQGFTLAYSDIPFDASQFTHRFTKEQAPLIRKILGVERTDYVTPAVTVVPELPKEEPKADPVPKTIFVKYGKSLIYHKTSHYERTGTEVSNITGLRPCKICKP